VWPTAILFFAIGLQLLAGTFLLCREWKRPGPFSISPPRWDISEKDFFLFLAGCFAALFLLPSPLLTLLPLDRFAPFLPALLLGCFLLLAWRSPSLRFSRGLNPRPLPGRTALAQGAVSYLRLAPLLFLAMLFWPFALSALQRWGVPIALEPQPLVSLLQEDTSPAFRCAALAVAVLLAPAVEELFFRGGLYRFFRRHWGAMAANAATALLFALAHGNWSALLPVLLLGLALGRSYEREGNLLPAIGIHACFNLNGVVLTLLAAEIQN
jgi:membrane protease YdiL (CAAX protease family)